LDPQAHISLADHAAAVAGKLYVNGGGWIMRSPLPIPWALTLEVKVGWHDNNRKMPFKLELLDADGDPVEVPTPQGPQPLMVEGEMKLTASPMSKPGSTIVGVNAAILPPIPLPPGEQFEWRLTLDCRTKDEWRTSFATHEMPGLQQQAG
jgi:hypothetical protein